MAIVIDEYSCTGCGACVDVCPSDVIRMDEEKNKATPTYNYDCVSCRLCTLICPFGSIDVKLSPIKRGPQAWPVREYLTGMGIDPATIKWQE